MIPLVVAESRKRVAIFTQRSHNGTTFTFVDDEHSSLKNRLLNLLNNTGKTAMLPLGGGRIPSRNMSLL
jgi:hypothetical protein